MSQLIEVVFLSQWTIFVGLVIAMVVLTQWALISQREYLGYALGWMVALFFIIVYSSLGGGRDAEPELIDTTLNIWQVFLSTFLGVVIGGTALLGLRYGLRYQRGASLQVAFYTALVLILLFIALIEGPIAQRMVGIFALAFGITSIFALVVVQQTSTSSAGMNAQGAPPRDDFDPNQSFDSRGGTSRLERIREDMQRRNNDR